MFRVVFVQPASQHPRAPCLRVVSVAGTRPEAIKLAPIVIEAAKRGWAQHRLIATGQQAALFDRAIAAFGVRVDCHLGDNRRSGSDTGSIARISEGLAREFDRERPDLVLVQGDTNSALAAARVAAAMEIPVGHVEAGLRTHDPASPFPEEVNRVEIARIAQLHFAPSESAARNLRAENARGAIVTTGNTGIDALMTFARQPGAVPKTDEILLTCHRRENFGAALERICAAVLDLARMGHRFVVPIHSNPAIATPLAEAFGTHTAIRIVPPAEYPALVAMMRAAPLVLSDSGGLQEECAALGVPLLILRDKTERPEVVASGNAMLVGSDKARIVRETLRVLADRPLRETMSVPSFAYGRGGAAVAIWDAIEALFAKQTGPKSLGNGAVFA